MVSNFQCYNNWAYSSLQKPIALWEWKHNTERPVLFIGGVHGDEPEGVWLAETLANWLQTQALNQKAHLLRNFLLITCLNPDGFFKNERTNANGVDLNRNFPSNDWSSETKAPRYFPGKIPNSEPETKALVQLVEQKKPQLIIHFHSWEPCIVYTGAPAKKVSELLGTASGYLAKEDIGYPTPGSLGQYAWLTHQIPVICMEEQEGCPRYSIWPRWQNVLTQILQKGSHV
jgi:predicted deacylase